jgi:hypothetical protein
VKDLRDLLPPPLGGTETSAPPTAPDRGFRARTDLELVQVLGGGLPAGHVHVWGGPPGCGKTAFLLALVHGAASRGRRAVYVTYDLPASTLALRIWACAAGLEPGRMSGGGLPAAERARADAERASLAGLPLHVLEARGFGVASIEDRLVRMPLRPDVVAIDFLQAVVRAPGTELGDALRDLTSLATRLHVAIVCAVRVDRGVGEGALDGLLAGAPDRVGWIAPAGGPGARRAEVLRNRYGERPALGLHVDPLSGGLLRSPDVP